MTARDAANAGLDRAVDGVSAGASAPELFAVVDVLEAQPSLRRSLSDPSASEQQRAGLARRLLEGKVGAGTLAVVTEVVKASWNSGNALAAALERQGVRSALRSAVSDGSADQVASELHTLSSTVDATPELSSALRDLRYPIEGKQSLIASLLNGKALPATQALAARAVRARRLKFGAAIDSYLDMAADMTGKQIAKVTVARPLDQARIDRLKAALEAQTGKPISLQIEVDPSVLGGMSVAIEDVVIESTVAGRLEQARRQLINL